LFNFRAVALKPSYHDELLTFFDQSAVKNVRDLIDLAE